LRAAGQALVFFALVLPLVLLPVAAFGVGAAELGARQAQLAAAVRQAAEDGVQELDVKALREGRGFQLDPLSAAAGARASLRLSLPQAVVDGLEVAGVTLTVRAHLPVRLELALLAPNPTVNVRAAATARLAVGYDRPSS
jgi:hypothetical protein